LGAGLGWGKRAGPGVKHQWGGWTGRGKAPQKKAVFRGEGGEGDRRPESGGGDGGPKKGAGFWSAVNKTRRRKKRPQTTQTKKVGPARRGDQRVFVSVPWGGTPRGRAPRNRRKKKKKMGGEKKTQFRLHRGGGRGKKKNKKWSGTQITPFTEGWKVRWRRLAVGVWGGFEKGG